MKRRNFLGGVAAALSAPIETVHGATDEPFFPRADFTCKRSHFLAAEAVFFGTIGGICP